MIYQFFKKNGINIIGSKLGVLCLMMVCLPVHSNSSPTVSRTVAFDSIPAQYDRGSQRTMSLTSVSKRRVYPNQARLSVALVSHAATFNKAKQVNAALVSMFYSELEKHGFNEKNISTSPLPSVVKTFIAEQPREHFEYVYKMQLRVVNESQMKAVMALAKRHNQINITNTEYEHVMSEKMYQSMKNKAIEKIMKDKALYEEALNVHLNTLSVSDSEFSIVSNNTHPTRAVTNRDDWGDAIKRRVYDNEQLAITNNKASALGAISKTWANPSFEEIQYNIVVRVDYELVDVNLVN